jgi:2,4-dienoyl-CoA reductase (NADPH2)
VTLFDAQVRLAGSLISPNRSPAKRSSTKPALLPPDDRPDGSDLRLNQFVNAADLTDFDEVILASGIAHAGDRGIDHPKVLSYLDVLRDKTPVGENVAIIGCGGIGFDTAMYLSQPGEATSQNIAEFCVEWGIDTSLSRLAATPGARSCRKARARL